MRDLNISAANELMKPNIIRAVFPTTLTLLALLAVAATERKVSQYPLVTSPADGDLLLLAKPGLTNNAISASNLRSWAIANLSGTNIAPSTLSLNAFDASSTGSFATKTETVSSTNNLDATKLLYGYVPLGRLTSITSNQIDIGTDAVYRQGAVTHVKAGSYVDTSTNGNEVMVSSRWYDVQANTNGTTISGYPNRLTAISFATPVNATTWIELELTGKYSDGDAFTWYWKGAVSKGANGTNEVQTTFSIGGEWVTTGWPGGPLASLGTAHKNNATMQVDIILCGKIPTICHIYTRARVQTFYY